jgi:hypothetical protein
MNLHGLAYQRQRLMKLIKGRTIVTTK